MSILIDLIDLPFATFWLWITGLNNSFSSSSFAFSLAFLSWLVSGANGSFENRSETDLRLEEVKPCQLTRRGGAFACTFLTTCSINCCCFAPFLFFKPNVLSWKSTVLAGRYIVKNFLQATSQTRTKAYLDDFGLLFLDSLLAGTAIGLWRHYGVLGDGLSEYIIHWCKTWAEDGRTNLQEPDQLS